MDREITDEAAARRRASVIVGATCLGQHKCPVRGCRDRNHRRDMAFWDELLKALGLKP